MAHQLTGFESSRSLRRIAVVGAIAVALATACGDSDDDSSAGGTDQTQATDEGSTPVETEPTDGGGTTTPTEADGEQAGAGEGKTIGVVLSSEPVYLEPCNT